MSSLSSIGSPTASSALSGTNTNSSGGTSSASGTGVTGLNSSGISFQGLASGLDTNKLIQGLLAVQQQQITNLQNQQAQIVQQETAFNTVQAKLLALQTQASGLSSTFHSVFDARTATSSNQNLATASASSGAQPGVYSFKVNSLAQAQEIASQGFDSASSAITQGVFQFQVGTGAINAITIDNTNNTLQGLAGAINSLHAGVTANVINDGSSSQGYHLLLTANNSGTANAITITNGLAASGGGALRPELSSTSIGAAVTGTGYSGTSTPAANSGSGGFTGAGNNAYTFTITNGGTVGTSDGITLSYADSTGANTGTITLNSGDAGVLKTVAQGIQVQFNAGTLVTGDTFTIKGFNPNVQAASNAAITLGSGGGALTVNSSTNQIQNVFNGITLNLVGADPTQTVNVTVANDTSTAGKAVDSFVSAYNDLIGFINQNSTYDATSQQAGILLGNFDATTIENNVAESLTGVVAGVNKLANNLAAVGVTLNADGTLAVDDTKLTQALSGQLTGVSSDDVRRLFVLDGQSTNNAVQFIFAGNKTKAAGVPIQVQITQAATQGGISATNPLAASTTITTGSNDTFALTVDGHTSNPIALAAGVYTQQQLAQQVQSAINAQLVGVPIAASVDGGGHLVLTSQSYGSTSQVAIGSGDALGALGFAGTEAAFGQDVAGSFLVNGVTETATGNGQLLTSNSSNVNTGGLEVRSTLTPAQITGTPEASVTVTQGIGVHVGNVLSQLLDPVSGQLATINQSLQSQADDIKQTIAQDQANMQQQQQTLLAEFSQMESTIAQLQAAGNTLGTSLTGFSSTSGSSNNGSSSGTLG
jgi:flagellar hook-associated protein 2